jgi:hypothetical protein
MVEYMANKIVISLAVSKDVKHMLDELAQCKETSKSEYVSRMILEAYWKLKHNIKD